jgi:hypothetical protein
MSMTQTTELKVAKTKTGKGMKDVRVTFTAINGTLEAQGKTMTFDSSKPGEANPALREALGAALGKSFVLVYDDGDRFREARELGAMASDANAVVGLGAIADAKAVAHLFRKSLEMGLPSIPVAPGDTWTADEVMAFPKAGDVHVDMLGKYETTETRDGRPHARIAFDGKLANVPNDKRPPGSIEIGEGSSMRGTLYFDLERRVVTAARYTTELKLGSMGESVPMTQRVTSEIVGVTDAAAQ